MSVQYQVSMCKPTSWYKVSGYITTLIKSIKWKDNTATIILLIMSEELLIVEQVSIIYYNVYIILNCIHSHYIKYVYACV